MRKRLFVLWIFLLPALLVACNDDKTMLHFTNATECGQATISLRNKDTGNIKEYTIDQGKEREIEVEPGIAYRYTVTYAGPSQPDLICDTKEVETVLVAGQTINVRLESVRDPGLPTPTVFSATTEEAATTSSE